MIVIAALARENRCIGHETRLPWHISEDMKRFKRLTYGFPMIMGRVTCEGLIRDFGKPLPGRPTLALTRNLNSVIHPDIALCPSLESALDRVKTAEKVFIAGGAGVYQEGLNCADRLELTLIDGAYEGDTFFPAYEHLIGAEFSLSHEDPHEGFSFVTYDRIVPPGTVNLPDSNRGRDPGFPGPPAQIRTCALTHPAPPSGRTVVHDGIGCRSWLSRWNTLLPSLCMECVRFSQLPLG